MNQEILNVALVGFDYIGFFGTIFVFLGIVTALFWPLIRESKTRQRKAMIIRSCLLRPLNAIDNKLEMTLDKKIGPGHSVFEEANRANFNRVGQLLEQSDCLTYKEIIMLENYIDYFKSCENLSSNDKDEISKFEYKTNELIAELLCKKQFPKGKQIFKKKLWWKKRKGKKTPVSAIVNKR
jgi:hypothetical protein